MSIVLKNQVEASEKSADEIEQHLQHDHRRAMLCYDVQDLGRSVVNLFRDINRDVDRWQNECAGRAPELCPELETYAQQWYELYARLAVTFEKVAKLIRVMEGLNFQVEGKQTFLIAWRELRGITCFSPGQVSTALGQVRSGRMRTLGEVRDALSGSSV